MPAASVPGGLLQLRCHNCCCRRRCCCCPAACPNAPSPLCAAGLLAAQVEPTTPPTTVACEAVVLHSRSAAGPRPTIITPHGGPHSAYMAQYFMPLSYLVSLGGWRCGEQRPPEWCRRHATPRA